MTRNSEMESESFRYTLCSSVAHSGKWSNKN